MTAKEYLSQAYRLDQRIRSKQEQIASLNDLATSCSATLTGMPRNPNRGGSRMADAVCKIIDLENEIAGDMERLSIEGRNHRYHQGCRLHRVSAYSGKTVYQR